MPEEDSAGHVYNEWQFATMFGPEGPLPGIDMSEELAESWLRLYGLPVIQFTLTKAIAAWIRRCRRENEDPTADPEHQRNYLQVALLGNQEKKFRVKQNQGVLR